MCLCKQFLSYVGTLAHSEFLNMVVASTCGNNCIIVWKGKHTYITDIIELFAICKGGNFNTHIWAWVVMGASSNGSAISSAKQGKSDYNLVNN